MGTFIGIPLWILLVILGPLNAQVAYEDYTVDETVDYTVDETVQGQVQEQQQQQQQIQIQQQQQQQQQQEENFVVSGPQRISLIAATVKTPVVKAVNTAHNNRVCSTWGNFHYKNFDGDIFYFPGTCNYVYASHCKSAYEDFNIQIRRTDENNVPVIDKITMKIDGLVVQLNHNTVLINGVGVQLPYAGSGVQIEKHGVYLTMTSKLGLVFMWNDDDSLLLELDEKYANQTCGLCGDFNGISIHNEFISNGVQITESQFGNLQKLDGPTEQCHDVPPTPKSNCTDYENICEAILLGSAFSSCHSLVGVQPYIEACVQDLCRCDSKATALCLCNTFAEYSRQCTHAGGHPENWRTKDFCPKTCPYNMQYQECGSPCADSCTNPERSVLCENHCLEGCFCPAGTVFDDINNSGCVPLEKCSCTFNSNSYAAGTSYTTPCSTCICAAGKWNCQNTPCPATCSIDGGSHITTYDQTHYSIHGDCNYVLTKECSGNSFTILTELRKCGLTESETCLKSTTLILNGETIIVIKPCGSVFVNSIYTQLPVSAANVTIFRPSSFYIIVETTLGVQLIAQLTPFMQVYVVLDPSLKGTTCGLCGNYNDKQTDEFQTISGIIEGTAASFANTWKTQADCANVKNVYEDPCALSVENEKYAQHWCGLITDVNGPFAACHATVNPEVYQKNCMFDTCNCEKSEDCMCASLSSYVHACSSKGVILTGWRSTACSKYMNTCPKSLNYTYSVSTCQPTCRSLSEPDVTCSIKFAPVDGCTCAKDFYMDDTGKCVPAAACPCYFKGSAVPSGEVVHDNGIMCTCTQGKLTCIGSIIPACTSPMVYFDCKNASADAKGAECQKSCQTLDMACYSAKCVSGCVCPQGLVSDGKGACIQEEQCPCIHNDASYQPGDQIKMKCNTCTCKDRMWKCTDNPCLATCAVYGDGHYITFDGKRYSFNGDCEYTLAQDHCGKGANGSTFRVITENIPCGSTGTTCSKSIKVFLGNFELILTEEHIVVVERGIGEAVPYKVRHMGIYLVIDADNGVILMWDRKTSIFIKLSKDFEGKVCGLCGDYDGNGNNDFMTRSQSVVGDVIEFGNSWKLSSTCPDANQPKDACSVNPYRKSWAQKQCSIINSQAFSSCHAQVDPSKYYDACVTDSCACDSGGDCECFCTAVAAYAQACGESGICVSWRSPNICPLFCDYYNPQGECEWHYKPCGAPCMKTCRNPSGKCLHELSGLEGCYPSCPAGKPFFDEDEMECVAQCGCYDDEGKHYKVGQNVPSSDSCEICACDMSGINCKYEKEACHCDYQGKKYNYNDVIYNTTDGIGGCISAICKENGTIYRDIYPCITTLTTTPFTFTSTRPSTASTGTTTPSTTTICVKEVCHWSEWFDVSYPEMGMNNGDFDTYENIKAKGYSICSNPKDIECRAERFPDTPLAELEQNVQCNVSFGLICQNKEQLPPICYNYQIKVKCCSFVKCDINTTESTTTSTGTTTVSTTASITTKETPSTTQQSTPEETTQIITTVTTNSPPTTPASTTTSNTPTPTICQPKCTWTTWIDIHTPGVGKNEGDFETYENIRAAGKKFCSKPDGIQCRAEKFPEEPIGGIGQVVQCNLTVGLICKNEDQEGDFKLCLNYQVKVLCCDDYSHCEQQSTTQIISTVSTTSETSTTSTTTPETTTRVTTPETTPTPETTTSISTTSPEVTSVSTTVSTTPETTTTSETTTNIIITIPETTTSPTTAPSTTVTPTTTSTTTTPLTTTTPISTTPEKTTILSTTTPEVTTHSSIEPPTPEATTTTTTTHLTTTTSTTISPTPETTTALLTTTPETTTPSTTATTVTETTTTTALTTETTTTSSTTPETTTKPETTTTTTISTTVPETSTTTETTISSTTPETTPSTTVTTTLGSPTTSATTLTTTSTTISTTSPETTTALSTTTPITTTSSTTVTTTPETTTPLLTTSSTTTSTTTPEATTRLSPSSKGKITTTAETTTEPTTEIVVVTNTFTTTKPPSSPQVNCEPQCKWTTWIDVDTPTSGLDGGDKETFETIKAKGRHICKNPQNIECRAEDFPGISIDNVGQIVQCDVTVGFVCNNKDQVGKVKQCYNYQIKVLCCDDYSHCSTTPVQTTSTVISTTKPVITTTETPVTTQEITTPTTPTTTESSATTTVTTTAKPTTSTTEITTPNLITTESTTSVIIVPTTETTTKEIITTATPPTTESETTSTTTTTTELTTTETPKTTSETTTSTTEIVTTTSSTCQPQCKWTTWIDVDIPTSGLDGGDKETFENIMAKGRHICKNPQNIVCRAEDFPGISIDNVGQIVQCDVTVGLVCNNKDQVGKVKQCYNYQIKVLCCDDYSHCSTTPVQTTSTVISTTKPVITTTETPVTTQEITTPTTPTTTESSATTTVTTTAKPTTSTTEITTPNLTTTESTTSVIIVPTTETTTKEITTTAAPTTTESETTSTTTTTTELTSTETPKTTSETTTSTTEIVTTTSSTCQPQCKWTTWIDIDTPTSGLDGGDKETFENIMAKGRHICKNPQNIVCRAEDFPGISIDNVGQIVQCDVTVGLVCNNKDQVGKVKQCYNYQIKVLCCDDYSHCSTTPVQTTSTAISTTKPVITTTETPVTTQEITTPTTPTTTESSATTTVTTTAKPTTSTTETTTKEITTTATPPTTESETTSTTTTTTELTTTETPKTISETTTSTTEIVTTTSSTCQPQCKWTTWIDIDTPTSGLDGGDKETFENIIAKGRHICKNPQNIECRAEDFPGISIDNVGQIVQCDVTVGFVCNNKDQVGKVKQCYNYQIKVLCCDDYSHCSTTPVQTTSTAISTTKPVITTTETPITTQEITTPTTPTTTESSATTTLTTTAKPTTSTTESTTPKLTTTESTTPVITVTTQETTTKEITTATPTTAESSTTSTTTTTTELTTETPKTTSETTVIIVTTPEKTTTESTPPTPTECQPKCKWSQWFDVDHPSSGIGGGDYETYKNIIAAGKSICQTPSDIQCRAVNFPGISIDKLDQDVTCNVHYGLVCKNNDQYRDLEMCYNYEIRVQCCDDYSHCEGSTTTSAVTTTVATTTSSSVTTTEPLTTTPKVIITTTIPITTSTLETTSKPVTTTQSKVVTTTQATTKEETTHHCFCHVENKFFSPGEVIYNKTDEAGCYFYAVCNDFCEAERFTGSCPVISTTTLATPVKTTTSTEPTTTQETTTSTEPTTTLETTTSTKPTTTQETTTSTKPTTTKPETSTSTKPTTTSPKTSTPTKPQTTTTTSTTTIVKTTAIEGCPPRKTNETWIINNCTVATCHGNNVVTIEPVSCPPVTPLACANGFPPVLKKSADGCCNHYECECVCSGWGDPHYITFDGTYYTFLDNCTYVLVQQITPKYDNFRVLVDNYFCDAQDGLSCPQSILIYYKSVEIVLTRMLYEGRMRNRIRYNNNWITPGFTKDGITITSAGINMNVEIPEIGAFISFSGMIFVVKLPFSKFGYNTEGQCGTCSNNSTEDCRLPSGKIVKDCSQMAPHWKVNVTDKPYCNVPPPPPTPPPTGPTVPPPTCPPSALCDVILSEVFAECHKIIPPKPYHEGCVFDACRIRNDSIQCSSLEIYASLCTANGVCVDWRDKTKGHCPYNCPAGKVYNPCGSIHTKTCDSKGMPTDNTGQTEGCYCPEGTTLFNSYTDTCVKSCSCVGPDGMPKSPAETWTSNCKQCICEPNSLTVQCEPLTCPEPAAITCDKEGFIIVQLPNPDQPCCMQNECRCNSSFCLNEVKKCDLGFEAVPVLLAGSCCPTYDCRPTEVCVFHEAIYQPGKPIPRTTDSCEECVCTNGKDPKTLLNLITCEPMVCPKNCAKGYTYKEVQGQCCGKCEQVECTMQTDDKDVITIKPGDTWSSPVDKCTTYQCNEIDGHFNIVNMTKACTVEDCPEGTVRKMGEDECCYKCEWVACSMKMKDNSTRILLPGETFSPPDEPCVHYECHQIEDQFVPVEVRRTCEIEECEPGYEYEITSGECCGKCVKVACVMHTEDNTTKIMKPGEVYVSPENKCTSHTCTSTYEIINVVKTCQAFNRSQCLEGTIKSDGCCESCESALSGCQTHKQVKQIKSGICESDQTVELSYCGGGCMTSSIYSLEANTMEHKCSCCQEVKTSKREVTLKCLDGTSSVYTYIYAEECGCTHTVCDSDTQITISQQEQQVDTQQTQETIVQEQQQQQTN